jgi:UDPglucose 6-dehydrogenase
MVRAFDPTVPVAAGQSSTPIDLFEPAVAGDSESGLESGVVRAYPDVYAACEGAAAAVVLTEWDEFRWLDFSRVLTAMAEPNIVDARNLLDPAAVRRLGFQYSGIGRQ